METGSGSGSGSGLRNPEPGSRKPDSGTLTETVTVTETETATVTATATATVTAGNSPMPAFEYNASGSVALLTTKRVKRTEEFNMEQPVQGSMDNERITYLVIDGENLDGVLGQLLNRKPYPQDRPRWNQVLEFAQSKWGQPVKSFFFIQVRTGEVPWPFVQAILAIGLRPFLLQRSDDEKVVDIAVQRTLEAIAQRESADVILASHDGDFKDQVERLMDSGRKVGLLAFREYLSSEYNDLLGRGLQFFDLEEDAHCFAKQLPRVRILSIEEFHPEDWL